MADSMLTLMQDHTTLATWLPLSLLILCVLFLGLIVSLLVSVTGNAKLRRRLVLPATGLSIVLFLLAVAVSLLLPDTLDRYHHDLYKAQYHGAPDDDCLVFEPQARPVMDGDGSLVRDDNGELVLEDRKVDYVLLGRPIGPDRGLISVQLWLESPAYYPEGSHLCSLPATEENLDFLEQAQEAWDALQQEKDADDGDNGRPDQREVVVNLPEGDLAGQATTSDADGAELEDGDRPRNPDHQQRSHGTISITVPERPLPPKE